VSEFVRLSVAFSIQSPEVNSIHVLLIDIDGTKGKEVDSKSEQLEAARNGHIFTASKQFSRRALRQVPGFEPVLAWHKAGSTAVKRNGATSDITCGLPLTSIKAGKSTKPRRCGRCSRCG
jgi:hypothetical protein